MFAGPRINSPFLKSEALYPLGYTRAVRCVISLAAALNLRENNDWANAILGELSQLVSRRGSFPNCCCLLNISLLTSGDKVEG